MMTEMTTYYLEMTDPKELRPKRLERPDLEINQAKIPSPELSRFLVTAVGGDWYWLNRLNWTYDQWLEWLERPGVETWVAYLSGTPAGFFELEAQPGGNVEIVKFGLLPQFIGKGLGGHLLTAAVERAWQMGASRVWLHTCTLDHPYARKNYCARGFREYKREVKSKEIPDQPPGPWPGAGKIRNPKFEARNKLK
jgi:GNAT superfamily N-acetyltransferase